MLIAKCFPQAKIRQRVYNMQKMQAMARVGLGVVAMPCHLGGQDAQLRRLIVKPMLDHTPDVWILYHPDSRQVKRVRLFVDFVSDNFAAGADLFSGKSIQA